MRLLLIDPKTNFNFPLFVKTNNLIAVVAIDAGGGG